MQIDFSEMLDSLLGALPQVGIYLKDKNKKVVWRSQKLKDVFGEDSIVGNFPESVVQDAETIDNLILSGEIESTLSKYFIELPNELKHPILIQKTPYRPNKGEIEGIVVVFFDLGSGFLTKLTEQDKAITWGALNNCVSSAVQNITRKVGGTTCKTTE